MNPAHQSSLASGRPIDAIEVVTYGGGGLALLGSNERTQGERAELIDGLFPADTLGSRALN